MCDACGVELKQLIKDDDSDRGLSVLECPSCLTEHETDVFLYDDAMMVRGVRRDFREGIEEVVELVFVREA